MTKDQIQTSSSVELYGCTALFLFPGHERAARFELETSVPALHSIRIAEENGLPCLYASLELGGPEQLIATGAWTEQGIA